MALLSDLQFLLQEVHSSKDTDKPFPLEKNSTHTELSIIVLKFSFYFIWESSRLDLALNSRKKKRKETIHCLFLHSNNIIILRS